MDPVGQAIWYIESHFNGDISLDDIADAGGVSRYYLSRAFGTVTGHSAMRYVRGRRLTEAARLLAAGAADILSVALEAGYGSHEAFTRAFREQFGTTPESVRAQRHLDNLALLEPFKMEDAPIVTLEPPRFLNGKALLIAGLSERYSFEACAAIPSQWQRFTPHIGNLPGQSGRAAYGVKLNGDDTGFDYVTGVEVAAFDGIPKEMARLRIAPRRYAVFRHLGHVATIRGTHNAIWSKWLPDSGHQVADAPDFERYGEDFDAKRGTGGIEIWIPLEGG
ncbi:MAG: AraC family transcriptional regulator [Dongiaceae bacterium]